MKPNPKRTAKGMYWDRAWSIVEGCTPVSAGCDHCWSAAQAYIRKNQANEKIRARYSGLTNIAGKFNGKVRLMVDDLDKPLRVKKPTVWAVWNDLFHKDVPFDFIVRAFGRMHRASQHIFLVLTKRPERMVEFCNEFGLMPDPVTGYTGSGETWPENVWAGVTAEDQAMTDLRIPILLQVPAAVRWVSVEPMLERIDLNADLGLHGGPGQLDWIVCGGETGPGARPMNPDWARALRDQCAEAGVPFWFKQMPKKASIPDDLIVRAFPEFLS